MKCSTSYARRRIAGFAFLLAVVVLPATAQSTRPGSVYSRFGVGERIGIFQARSWSMGGPGYALGGGGFASLANPALLADLTLTRASAGVQFDNIRATNEAGDASELSAGAFSGFSLGIPLISSRLGLIVGLSPYSRVGYRVTDESTFPSSTGDPVTYGASLEGNGGLDRVSLGVGYRLSRRVSVGVRGDFLFGILEYVRRTRYFDFHYDDTRLAEATRLRGFALGAGIRASLPSLLRDGDILSVGLAVDAPAHLTGERIITAGEAFDPDTLRASIDGTADLPLGLGFGIAYQASVRFAAMVDLRYEPWSSFESSFDFPAYDDGGQGRLEDRTRVSGGFEFYPAGRDLLAGFFRRTSYRFGLFYERSYVSPLPDSRVNVYGLTGGLSFPTLFPGTRVDVHAEVGNRGSAEGLLIQDRYLRIGISVNFADRWFVRRRLG